MHPWTIAVSIDTVHREMLQIILLALFKIITNIIQDQFGVSDMLRGVISVTQSPTVHPHQTASSMYAPNG